MTRMTGAFLFYRWSCEPGHFRLSRAPCANVQIQASRILRHPDSLYAQRRQKTHRTIDSIYVCETILSRLCNVRFAKLVHPSLQGIPIFL